MFKSILSLVVLSAPLLADTAALLQSSINANSENTKSSSENTPPGSVMRLVAQVENVGNKESSPAEIFIRFAYPKPLDTQKNSVLYQSEKKPLPSLKPNEKVTITFTKTHTWPSLFDYIRQDWALRNYEAVIVYQDKEMISGTTNVTFTAYYYEGISREIPVPVGENTGNASGQPKILPHPTRVN